MNVLAVCAAAVTASLVALLLKKNGSEFSFILSVSAVTLILVYVISSFATALDFVRTLADDSLIRTSYLEILLRCMGICFLTEFTCDCCKDASQSALSGVVLLCGRISVLIASMPLFTEFLNVSLELSGGSV